MIRSIVSVLLCAITFLIPESLRAGELAIDFDPMQTKILFVVTDVLHAVHGRFRLKQGHISVDPSTRTITGDVIVDADSGNSGSARRDRRMTRDVLQARRYPQIRFSPTAYNGFLAVKGASTLELTGLLFIHGQAHNITLPIRVQMSRDQVTATTKFVIPYVKWGMKNPSTLFLKVSPNVEIDVTAVGHTRKADGP